MSLYREGIEAPPIPLRMTAGRLTSAYASPVQVVASESHATLVWAEAADSSLQILARRIDVEARRWLAPAPVSLLDGRFGPRRCIFE